MRRRRFKPMENFDPKRSKRLRETLSRARCDLQFLWGTGLTKRELNHVHHVMGFVDDYGTVLRQQAVFEAGRAEGKKRRRAGNRQFEGRSMGSMELMTFYDGMHDTWPEFQNPYRATYGR